MALSFEALAAFLVRGAQKEKANEIKRLPTCIPVAGAVAECGRNRWSFGRWNAGSLSSTNRKAGKGMRPFFGQE